MNGKGRATIGGAALVALLGSATLLAEKTQKPVPSDNYDEMFARYLKEAHQTPAPRASDAWNWMSGLALDLRARRLNDVITISVVENIVGSGTADAALGKTSSAAISLPNLFGLEKKLPSAVDPANLVGFKGDSQFKGTGATNRSGILTAQLAARVSEVLPNGDLVVEGVREIAINGDQQVLVLTGVVRVADISSNNVVLSTSIGQLRIRYFGRGLMKDNLNPGWLIRVLNKIF
jgi:flagellar L-ring protein precursor FlgH